MVEVAEQEHHLSIGLPSQSQSHRVKGLRKNNPFMRPPNHFMASVSFEYHTELNLPSEKKRQTQSHHQAEPQPHLQVHHRRRQTSHGRRYSTPRSNVLSSHAHEPGIRPRRLLGFRRGIGEQIQHNGDNIPDTCIIRRKITRRSVIEVPQSQDRNRVARSRRAAVADVRSFEVER